MFKAVLADIDALESAFLQGIASFEAKTPYQLPAIKSQNLALNTIAQSLTTLLQSYNHVQEHLPLVLEMVNRQKALNIRAGEADRRAAQSRSTAAQAFALDYSIELLLASPPVFVGSPGARPVHTAPVTYAWKPSPADRATVTHTIDIEGKDRVKVHGNVKVEELLRLAERLATQSQAPVESPSRPNDPGGLFPMLKDSQLQNSPLRWSLQNLLNVAQSRSLAWFGYAEGEGEGEGQGGGENDATSTVGGGLGQGESSSIGGVMMTSSSLGEEGTSATGTDHSNGHPATGSNDSTAMGDGEGGVEWDDEG